MWIATDHDPNGGLLAVKKGTGTAAAALTDLHGDLVATYTSTVQTSPSYDPFGTVIAQTGTRTQLGYQGEYTDPDTGKVNMHARWYQPATGTFTSRDTATLTPTPSVQANRYTYANATSLIGTDPTGHATYYIPDSSGGYSQVGGNTQPLGPKPGQLVIGSPEYNDLIRAPGDSLSGSPYAQLPGFVCSGSVCAETAVNERWWTELINSPGWE
ncbi:RHS repeat-associated core domain-containing protein [Nonomuraea bangladeshensis]